MVTISCQDQDSLTFQVLQVEPVLLEWDEETQKWALLLLPVIREHDMKPVQCEFSDKPSAPSKHLNI